MRLVQILPPEGEPLISYAKAQDAAKEEQRRTV